MTWEAKKAKSIAYLDKYKDEISQEAYNRILWVIGNQAQEDMFPDEISIDNLIQVEKGEITTNELIQEYKNKWGVA